MWISVGLICIYGLLLGAVFVLARKNGSKAAQLEALKAEVKERQRANKIMDNVRNMSADDVRRRLQNLSDK